MTWVLICIISLLVGDVLHHTFCDSKSWRNLRNLRGTRLERALRRTHRKHAKKIAKKQAIKQAKAKEEKLRQEARVNIDTTIYSILDDMLVGALNKGDCAFDVSSGFRIPHLGYVACHLHAHTIKGWAKRYGVNMTGFTIHWDTEDLLKAHSTDKGGRLSMASNEGGQVSVVEK